MTFGKMIAGGSQDKDDGGLLESIEGCPGGMTGIKDIVNNQRGLACQTIGISDGEEKVRKGLTGMSFLEIIETLMLDTTEDIGKRNMIRKMMKI